MWPSLCGSLGGSLAADPATADVASPIVATVLRAGRQAVFLGLGEQHPGAHGGWFRGSEHGGVRHVAVSRQPRADPQPPQRARVGIVTASLGAACVSVERFWDP
jgi:hypothetical protein